MKNFFSNQFAGSENMNIALGKNAIASQINTITTGRDGKTTTVVTQQAQGHGNVFSGTGTITIDGAEVTCDSDFVTIGDNIFINKDDGGEGEEYRIHINTREGKMSTKKVQSVLEAMEAQMELFMTKFGVDSDFVLAYHGFLKNPESAAYKAVFDEEGRKAGIDKDADCIASARAILEAVEAEKAITSPGIETIVKELKSSVLKLPISGKALKKIMNMLEFIELELEEENPDVAEISNTLVRITGMIPGEISRRVAEDIAAAVSAK